ncbi:MAG: DNA-processing protein DprA [Lachnospiraceae bacterium]|nr:DNA-processing protein DprA [Lachnospiraceae bacterium]
MEEWKYQYWLQSITGIKNKKKQILVEYCGGAKELYYMKEKQLASIYGILQEEIDEILATKKSWDLNKEAEWLEAAGVSMVSIEDKCFPKRLYCLGDCPYAVFYKGNFPTENEPTAAIVGSRACSEYGRTIALELGKKLSACGISVVSGMAVGIDSFGHWGAIHGNGKTYAVLGCGVDVCYPNNKGGRELYHRILEKGGILSEYSPGTVPAPWRFPARNRLISAFSDIIIVVEAKKKSGSLITADFALEQGKDVYAVPGRLDDASSYGCNALIKQGAGIIVSVEELLLDLDLCMDKILPLQEKRKKSLEKQELLLYSCFGLHTKNLEELMQMTGLSSSEVTDVVVRLQEKGFIEETFKNHYRKK